MKKYFILLLLLNKIVFAQSNTEVERFINPLNTSPVASINGKTLLPNNVLSLSSVGIIKQELLRPTAAQEINSGFLEQLLQNSGNQNVFAVKNGMDSTGIIFTGYSDRNAILYKKNEVPTFAFYENELRNEQGNTLALATTTVSSYIDSRLPVSLSNGAVTVNRAAYSEKWMGTAEDIWASLTAGNDKQPTSLTLFSSQTEGGLPGIAAFVLDHGNGHKFTISSNGLTSNIGWNNSTSTTLHINTSMLQTTADFYQQGIFKNTGGLAVYNGDLNTLTLPEYAGGYFLSDEDYKTGIFVENRSFSPIAAATITLAQQNTINWIATYSSRSMSDFYLPGSLVLESGGMGGILLSANSIQNSALGSIRFGIDEQEVARFTPSAFFFGNVAEPSFVFRMDVNSKGYKGPNLTTAEIKSMAHPEEGTLLYNKTNKKWAYFNGNTWRQFRDEEMR